MQSLMLTAQTMSGIEAFIDSANGLLWGWPMLIALVGAGVFFTIRLGFPQIVRMGVAMKRVFGGMFKKEKTDGVSSFQSLATAIAAQIGTGNVAGVATAIMAGGPGAIFWMWMAAIFGMGTIFVEAVLAQKYRETRDGELVGGPAYYIKNGLKNKTLGRILSVAFSILIIIALGFVGNLVQSNSIADAVSRAFQVPALGVGIVIAVLAAFIFIGGIKRISQFAELVVPFMAAIYILGSIAVLILFASDVPRALASIFIGAFDPQAILGGAAGIAMKEAIRYGVARGLFSNEAGMGSTPHAHAVADVKHPVEQGLTAMVGVFIDTIVVCTCTALVILVTGANLHGYEAAGVTQAAFSTAFGPMGEKFLAICLTFFSFTTIVGWYYFGESNVRYLFKNTIMLRVYQLIVIVFIVGGSFQKVGFVWNLADFTNGLMVIPNLIGIVLLSGQAVSLLKDYDKQLESGEDLKFNYEYQ